MSLPDSRAAQLFGSVGRLVEGPRAWATTILGQAGGIFTLLVEGLVQAALAPFTGPRRLLAKQLFPLMSNVGARSLIVIVWVTPVMVPAGVRYAQEAGSNTRLTRGSA